MSAEHTFEHKGKVNPKQSHEHDAPPKKEGPITLSEMKGRLDANKVQRMQKTLGNAAVQRFLAQRSGVGQSEVDEETASAINAEKGGGQALDEGIAAKAGSVMGQDFGSVNVHTGGTADSLNTQLQAKAFTVGNDIFFKDGEYEPSTSDGQHLISHELTHVAQQGASTPDVQGKMTVNDPDDQYEAEADSVADTVMNSPDEDISTKLEAGTQRQDDEDEGEEIAALKRNEGRQRQDEEELAMKQDPSAQRQDEEELAMKQDPSAQRQDEEELAMKREPAVQRQEEEEMMTKKDPALQRQEEEEMMTKKDPALQKQEEEEMMTKKDPALQRQEEEEMMTKKDPALQRQEELPEEAL